jgi:prophage regulatory protein
MGEPACFQEQRHGEDHMSINILRKPAVLAKIGYSDTSLWRDVRAGRFPKPIRLGPNRVGWDEGEINRWLEDRRQDGGRSR